MFEPFKCYIVSQWWENWPYSLKNVIFGSNFQLQSVLISEFPTRWEVSHIWACAPRGLLSEYISYTPGSFQELEPSGRSLYIWLLYTELFRNTNSWTRPTKFTPAISVKIKPQAFKRTSHSFSSSTWLLQDFSRFVSYLYIKDLLRWMSSLSKIAACLFLNLVSPVSFKSFTTFSFLKLSFSISFQGLSSTHFAKSLVSILVLMNWFLCELLHKKMLWTLFLRGKIISSYIEFNMNLNTLEPTKTYLSEMKYPNYFTEGSQNLSVAPLVTHFS